MDLRTKAGVVIGGMIECTDSENFIKWGAVKTEQIPAIQENSREFTVNSRTSNTFRQIHPPRHWPDRSKITDLMTGDVLPGYGLRTSP
jgi:hypothetical protein